MNENIEALWQEFSLYVCLPYANNKELLPQMRGWVDDLKKRQEGGYVDFELSRFETCSKNGRYSFSGYCLGKQMFISGDPAILTHPHPDLGASYLSSKISSSKFVGIWLHDFGAVHRFEKFLLKGGANVSLYQGYTEFDALKIKHFYVERVIHTLDASLRIKGVPRINANELRHQGLRGCFEALVDKRMPHDTQQVLRTSNRPCLQADDYVLYSGHYDGEASSKDKSYWGRFYIFPIRGDGTGYALGNDNSLWVSSPVGAASSHLYVSPFIDEKRPEIADLKGIWHRAGTGNADGRDVLILASRGQKSFASSPWEKPRFQSLEPAS